MGFQYLHKLWNKLEQKNLWLTNDMKKNKNMIVNSLALNVLSSGLMILEDFLVACKSIKTDIKSIPLKRVSYKKTANILKFMGNILTCQTEDPFYELLHYIKPRDLEVSEMNFLTKSEKEMIITHHKENIRAFKHTLKHVVRFFRLFQKKRYFHIKKSPKLGCKEKKVI